MSDKKTIIVTQKKSPIGRQAYQRQTLKKVTNGLAKP